jgi:hypothetical protein
MSGNETRQSLRSALVWAGALLVAAPWPVAEAKADVAWTLNDVAFNDGATANGTFTINANGNLTQSSISVTTTAGSSLDGDTYSADLVAGEINHDPTGPTITFYSSTLGDAGTLTLQFEYALTVPRAANLILGGSECVDCPNIDHSVTPMRHVTQGFGAGHHSEPRSPYGKPPNAKHSSEKF